ncbi:MAG: ATP-binding protein, partial [bacterium]|nr:ATP-binding protein [bacterium]
RWRTPAVARSAASAANIARTASISPGTDTIGSITLSAEAFPRKVRISVSDTGAGIPAEFLPRIFDRFYQVDGSSTRKYGGVGLGLSIVKAIVEAHGGKIEVSSRLGGGTSFSFELSVPD